MNLTLTRNKFLPTGIFSTLADENGVKIASTLEHSYNNQPKLQPGVYKCVRGMHRLHGMTSDFETFEITGVTGHSGILFHWGNYNKDSDGCVLLGDKNLNDSMVTNSKATFAKFMKLLANFNEITLTVL